MDPGTATNTADPNGTSSSNSAPNPSPNPSPGVSPSPAPNSNSPVKCAAGYVLVSPMPPLFAPTLKPFCVMKYEAKYVTTAGVVIDFGWSTADVNSSAQPLTGTPPWSRLQATTPGAVASIPEGRSIFATHAEAVAACAALSVNGHRARLMSNMDWQALGHSIELTAANWSGGTVGSGAINGGSLPIYNTIDPNVKYYIYTINISPHSWTFNPPSGADDTQAPWSDSKRTHWLPSGDLIWDVSGGLPEWVAEVGSGSWGNETYLDNGPEQINSVIVAENGMPVSLLGSSNAQVWNGVSLTPKQFLGPVGNYPGLEASQNDGGLGHNHLLPQNGDALQNFSDPSPSQPYLMQRGHDGIYGTISTQTMQGKTSDPTQATNGYFGGFRCAYEP